MSARDSGRWRGRGAGRGPLDVDRLGRDRALQQRAHAPEELRLFLRRFGILMGALTALRVAGTIAFVAVEGVAPAYVFDWTVDTVATLGWIPDPRDAGGRIVKVGL